MMLNVGWLARSSTVHGERHTTTAMRYLVASLVLLVALAAGLPASAQPQFPRGGVGAQMPLDSIINNIRRQFPGQVSDVQQLGARFRVKWLTPDGRVLFIDVDARSGQILGVNGGGGGPGPGRNFDGPPPRFMRQNFQAERNREVSREEDAIERPAPGARPRPGGRGRGRFQGNDN